MYERKLLTFHCLFFDLQLLFQCRQLAITEFRCLFQITLSLRNLYLAVHFFNLFPQSGKLFDGTFFIVPLSLPILQLFFLLRQLFLKCLQTIAAQPVILFFQGGLFDLHLHHLPLQFIQFRWHGIQLRLY